MKLMNDKKSQQNLELDSAAHLASVEIILGSLGHGFKIPFTGTFLSFYQLYIGLRLMIRDGGTAIQVFNISVIVALLKTLSPSGKKITPMIAIATQGFFLWLGTVMLGETLFGMVVGSALFVSWSLVQSVIGYVLLYGFDFFKMMQFLEQELGSVASVNIYFVILGYWLFRVGIALALILYLVLKKKSSLVWSLDDSFMRRIQNRFVTASPTGHAALWKSALRDLVNPIFFLSLVLMTLFHLYRDTSTIETVWFVCRTVATGFVLFYLLRSDWIKPGLFYCFGSTKQYRSLYRKVYRVRRRLISN